MGELRCVKGHGSQAWPPALAPGQRSDVMAKYPHMADLDTMVWTEFLRELGPQIDRVWYDVKVGSPIGIAPGSSAAMQRVAEGCGCRRIDAVCQASEELWVIEVKPLGDHVALGQALTYLTLFVDRFKTDVWCVPMVVCSDVDSDMSGMFEQEGVRLVVTAVNPFGAEP